MASVDEVLTRATSGVASLSNTLTELAVAYRTELEALRKKNEGLVEALKAGVAHLENTSVESIYISGLTVLPDAFADRLSCDVVKLAAFDREFSIHRSILAPSPFFQAKLERWSHEELMIPETVSEKAFASLVGRLYFGARWPIGDVQLAVQVLHLAKLWLFQDVAQEVTRELCQTARQEHVGILKSLADAFDLPELHSAVDNLQKSRFEVSPVELEFLLHQAIEGAQYDWERKLAPSQSVCEAALRAHPEASKVMLAQFNKCDFFFFNHEETNSYNIRKVVHRLECPWGLAWFWKQVMASNLLDEHLAQIAESLNKKLAASTGYRVQDHYCGGSEKSRDATPTTFLTTLYEHSGNAEFVGRIYKGLINKATYLLQSGQLKPHDLDSVIMSMHRKLWHDCVVDKAAADMISVLPLAINSVLLRMLSKRLNDVGPQLGRALQHVS